MRCGLSRAKACSRPLHCRLASERWERPGCRQRVVMGRQSTSVPAHRHISRHEAVQKGWLQPDPEPWIPPFRRPGSLGPPRRGLLLDPSAAQCLPRPWRQHRWGGPHAGAAEAPASCHPVGGWPGRRCSVGARPSPSAACSAAAMETGCTFFCFLPPRHHADADGNLQHAYGNLPRQPAAGGSAGANWSPAAQQAGAAAGPSAVAGGVAPPPGAW